ncbi:unnamed protein product [Rhizophagus irregularis]|nr:unnamed protein product [Rhizophagus irregularis]
MPPICLEKPRSTRTAISVEVKKEICEYIVANPNVNQGDVTTFFNTKYQNFGVDRTTINKIWKEREKWLVVLSTSQTPHIFRHRSVQFPELDKAMQIWTSQATAAGLPLTDMILQQKGKEFAKMLNIEDQLKSNSAPLETLPEEHLRLRTLLAKYNEEDIYNADETGLFFRMEPNHTLSSGKISGRKQNNSRLSVLLCSNSTGSHKFPLLVIGKANNPCYFKNINKTSLPVTYRANSKAWMRSDIFVEWLHHLDNWFRVIDQKILLLIDNARSHFNPKTFDEDSSNLSEDNEENVAESSHSTQNRKRNKLNIKEAIDYIAEANMQDFEIDESDELDGINIDCLPEVDKLREYLQMFDQDIPTEEQLNDEQIINLLQNENDESDDDDSDEEILLVSEKQGVDALKIFINYFEQQNDPEFNIDDLRFFKNI